MFWDSRINELVTCDGKQVGFPNNSLSILPILIDNHWAGIEVIRLAEVVQVLFVQVPAELQVRLHQILSRIFDVSPAMITVTEVYNLCGWVLLKRWSAMLPFKDWQDPVDMTSVPPTKLQAIQIAIESSQEEWHASGADQSLFRFATQCRTRFLAYLARSTTAVSSAVTTPLSTNVHSIEINPEARAATLSPFSGETPRHLIDYINRRLEDFRSEPTWAASDEIDFALDVVRLYVSHTLIITPLVWDTHTTSFRSITGVETPLAGFTDFVVPIGRHWVQCDVFAQGQTLFVLFANSLPNDADPQVIAVALGRLFGAHESNVTFVASDTSTPEGMCGWSLIKRLFDRYRIPIPAVAVQMTQALSESQFSQVLALILDHANASWADNTDDTTRTSGIYVGRSPRRGRYNVPYSLACRPS